ncbi:oxidation resistance protein 1 isoform X2 [Ricinus communis]|uniref:oxidation resistance protein 1 isoform X2 n=1 Tax=Ricinus communis TaxID=3988 RepID=UPI00201B14C7|nr:oxidation resistance protein 1 isoform X2 [Ricinus communis]
MHSLKDKVSNQLSRIFADSPNHNSPSSPPDNSQARPFSSGGKSFSSYFSFGVPSLNLGGSKSNKQQQDLKPLQSLPVRWGSKGFKQQDGYTVKYHECNTLKENENLQLSRTDGKESSKISVNKGTDKINDINENGESGRSSSDSDIFEEAREQQTPRSSLPDLMEESSFISSELYEFLQSSLPNIVKGCQWALLYSTLKHGISLRTLIRKSSELSGPCLLIVGDRQGAVFGGLLECPLKPTPKRKYQGTNQSFVFTTIYGEPRLFRPTGANRYYYMCLNDLLALGGAGNFALCVDGDLLNGTSGPCDTYGNLCLAHKPEFELKNVELWGFTHSSKYLT